MFAMLTSRVDLKLQCPSAADTRLTSPTRRLSSLSAASLPVAAAVVVAWVKMCVKSGGRFRGRTEGMGSYRAAAELTGSVPLFALVPVNTPSADEDGDRTPAPLTPAIAPETALRRTRTSRLSDRGLERSREE